MYKILIPVLLLLIAASSCNKNTDSKCPEVVKIAPDSEIVRVARYIDTSNTAAVKDYRGFYYAIQDTGIGQQPHACNAVKVNYTGRFINGTVFNAAHNISFSLKQVITGWQEGIPLIKNGGRITLFIPPALAYGQASSATIPGNSILIFSIELVGVQ